MTEDDDNDHAGGYHEASMPPISLLILVHYLPNTGQSIDHLCMCLLHYTKQLLTTEEHTLRPFMYGNLLSLSTS